MNPEAVGRAENALARAREKLEAMKATTDFSRFMAEWSDFLVAANRVFVRLEGGTRIGSSKGWFDRKKHDRRTDPVLCYVWHARNADEHGLSPVIGQEGASIQFVPKEGAAIIRRLKVQRNGRVDIDSDRPVGLVFHPERLALKTVRDRGTDYPAPTADPSGFFPMTALEVAEHTIRYMAAMVDEARAQR